MVRGRRHKNLVLILAREFASKLATATFVVDAEGSLIFFNEPAEEILGRSFSQAGEVAASELATLFSAHELDGSPAPADQLPLATVLRERRPTHHVFRITALDGIPREIAVTGMPLFARADEFVGAVAFFWERREGS